MTAHPTEVQRQATLNFHRRIRALLPRREHCISQEEHDELQREIQTVLLALWQTSETRHFKISVESEIRNGVSIFPLSFFQAVPQLYRTMQRDLEQAYPNTTLPNILHIGGWIGGNRDGNPFVTADTLQYAFMPMPLSAITANNWANCSRLTPFYPPVEVNNAVMRLSAASPDTEIAHEEEPYRRAIALMTSRLIVKHTNWVPP